MFVENVELSGINDVNPYRLMRFWKVRPLQFVLFASIACVTLGSLTGCASYWVRKDCEKVDWFAHGQSVAMSGNRLSGNERVRRCEEAETNIDYVALDQGFKKGMATYCLPETVMAIGKRGEYFAAEMCDGENIRLLRSRHAAGVVSFCQKENGYSAGATGTPYNQICPKELEPTFMPEFKKGRKAYLSAAVARLEGEISDNERDISQLESQKMMQWHEYNMIQPRSTLTRQVVYDPVTRAYREESSVQEDVNAKMEKENAMSRIRSTESSISTKRESINQLRTDRRKLAAELATL